jgi:AcrR family transcriptional regulator
MATGVGTEPRQPGRGGRPRSERARQAIVRATADLLVEHGLREMSIDAVALRAGVSKATIYRWWTSKHDLALDAFLAVLLEPEGPAPDTGSLERDLLERMRSSVLFRASTPAGRVMASLIAEAQRDREFATSYRLRVLEPLREQTRVIFDRAAARGDIAPIDADVALDMLYGSLTLRLVLGHAPLDERFARAVVDIALHGVLSSRDGGGAATDR